MGRITDGWSAAQIRAAEAPLLAAGVPLMRRAAAGLAAELRAELSAHPAGEVLLLAGSGDNGGDGLWAASELAAEGVPVRIVATGSRIHEEGLAAATGAGAVLDAGAADDPGALAASLGDRVLVVDAMVGTGSTTGLRGRALEVVRALLPRIGVRREPLRVVAVDLPSGIGVDDGSVPADGVVLPAEVTVTFGGVKAGLLLQPAASLAGEVRLIDIGLGPGLARIDPAVTITPR
jgi:NAD(P)H-hydrate epimerase